MFHAYKKVDKMEQRNVAGALDWLKELKYSCDPGITVYENQNKKLHLQHSLIESWKKCSTSHQQKDFEERKKDSGCITGQP